MVRAAKFTATLDRDTVAVGESATLSLKFEGGQPGQMPSPPAIPNLQVASKGAPSQYHDGERPVLLQFLPDFALTPMQPGACGSRRCTPRWAGRC